MSPQSIYTLYHPRWYRRRISVWWWLGSRPYVLFVTRELTSLAVAYFAIIFLWKLHAIARGSGAYAEFLQRMRSPIFAVPNALAFLFVMFHAITWFNLAPRAMALRMGGKRLPDWLIQGMNYLVWVIATAAILWMAERG